MLGGLEFDWDSENRGHLAEHKVTPAEFEEVLSNDPMDFDYDFIDGEDRYRSIGLTNGGRLLSVVWTLRHGRVRAVTAFRTTVSQRRVFLERA